METNQSTRPDQPETVSTPKPNPKQSLTSTRGLNRRAVVLAIVLFVVIILGMFAFVYLQREPEMVIAPDIDETATTTEEPYAGITRVDATHFYSDGTHTVVGEIPMPTPCDLLAADARVTEGDLEQVTIDFEVINNAEMCAQVITPQRFMVTAEAGPGATFSAVLMDRAVELNLVEAPPGETPEDFELFIKG